MATPADDRPVVLYFGNDWFAENRTSSHQIARQLAKRFTVYYIECPGLRAPKSSGRDLRKIRQKIRRWLRGAQPTPEGLHVFTLLQIPLHRFAVARWLNRLLIRWTIQLLMWRRRIHGPLVWLMVPHLPAVIGKLGERLSVYYCIDDYAALPDVNPDAVRQLDDETTRKANLVFVASATLLEGKLQLNPNTLVSPHGVDYDFFSQAQDEGLAIPADTTFLPRPVIGFFGLIERWIDLGLIDYLAEQRPHWTFVLIGRAAVPETELPRRSNIHLIGQRPYAQLAAYGKQFDAAIIPYHLTRQVINANPIKLREYLAMGKPVVSVSTPEIDKYADVVEIASTREEFLAKLDQVLARPATVAETRRRMERVVKESWEARVAEVLEKVQEELRGRN